MPDRLLYVAHTSPAIREQALYSALSALAHAEGAPPAIHVYTDAPEAFAPLEGRAEVRAMGVETFRSWALPAGYNHRAKPAAIRDLARRHPGDRVLFADADTFFTGPVQALFSRIEPGVALMHEREYNVGTSDLAVMHRFRRHMRRATFRGAPVPTALDMWNSGAVGLHPAQFALVDDWLAFVDEVYPPTRRWILEQFAISWTLQRAGVGLSSCEDVLVHYWFDKPGHSAAVAAALARARALPLDAALADLRARPIDLPRAHVYGEKANFFQRVFGW